MDEQGTPAGGQLPLVIFLVVVIVAALSFAVWNAWAPGKAAGTATATGSASPGSSGMDASVADPPPIDQAAFANMTQVDGLFEKLGTGSKVLVYACVPDPGGGCHGEAVQVLKELAQANLDTMSLYVMGIHTPAAEKAGLSCAGYVINGTMRYSYTKEDGTTRSAIFTKSSGMGSWTVEDLRAAVEAALAGKGPKPAESGSESGSESSPRTAQAA